MMEDLNHTPSQLRLLIVDDEEELRSLLALKFNRSGFAVDVAADGAQAAELMNTENYTAILCDLNLPQTLKGQDLFALACKNSKKSKFIAITGYAQDSPEVRAARTAGIEHIFSKPLPFKTILNLLRYSPGTDAG